MSIIRNFELVNPETGELVTLELPLYADEIIKYRNWEFYNVDEIGEFTRVDLNNLEGITLERLNQLDSILDDIDSPSYEVDDIINLYVDNQGRIEDYKDLLSALHPQDIEYCYSDSADEYARDYLYDNYGLPDSLDDFIDFEGYGEYLLNDTWYTYCESGGMITCTGWNHTFDKDLPLPLTAWLNTVDRYILEHGCIYAIIDATGCVDSFVSNDLQREFMLSYNKDYGAVKVDSLDVLLNTDGVALDVEVEEFTAVVSNFIHDIIYQD